ncbi:glycosyltransferase [Chryseobacterium bernardetii]|uniref:glycosyltransferase n=1 Tax=Chryseobacterium bernardetii TaxID=1241978 RepID=UPI003AF887D4
MLLIDAIFINNGGGRVLLNYLITELEKREIKVFYLLDERLPIDFTVKQSNEMLIINSSLSQRKNFYKLNSKKFNKIFVLGNIPPPISVKKSIVYTYFHNLILLNVPRDFSFIEKIKYTLKVAILKKYSKNTNTWLFQSKTLENQFVEKFKQKDKAKILPFYPSLISDMENKDSIRKNNTFLYASNAQANKNHPKLINAFCKAYDKIQKGKLIVTVSEKFPLILQLINNAISKGYPIENLGFVKREDLIQKYLETEYVIYPSLAESFGLGLIEGIELGCKIIGADLPYTYAVCDPSLVFDPMNEKSIMDTIVLATEETLKNSELKVKDQVLDLINLLSTDDKN